MNIMFCVIMFLSIRNPHSSRAIMTLDRRPSDYSVVSPYQEPAKYSACITNWLSYSPVLYIVNAIVLRGVPS